MKTRTVMLRALAVIFMGAMSSVMARPAVAAPRRLCTQYCSDVCSHEGCDPCDLAQCNGGICTGASGQTYNYELVCV
jgi:hypothetical protein